MPRRAPAPAARRPIGEVRLSGQQQKAVSSTADIVIYGGGNGSGKTRLHDRHLCRDDRFV